MSNRSHPSSPESVNRQYENDDEPTRSSMRGDMRITRNPSSDQKNDRRRLRQRTAAEKRTVTCPQCRKPVLAEVEDEAGRDIMTCPSCGYHGPLHGSKEGNRMTTPTPADVSALRREAAMATTAAEQMRLMGEAEHAADLIRTAHQQSRDVDLGAKIAADHLTPAPVHELNTPATDWLGAVASKGAEGDHVVEMQAQASLWYDRVHEAAKADDEEFGEQARGIARHYAGAYGEHAEQAENAFLQRAATLRQREVDRGSLVRIAAIPEGANPEAHDPGDFHTGQPGYNGLPGAQTSSERMPVMQDLTGNPQDMVQVNDPGLGETHDHATELNGPGHRQEDAGVQNRHQSSRRTANDGEMPEFLKKKIDEESDGDTDAPDPKDKKKESSMSQIANCPACKGRGKVAVRAQGASGLHQIDEIADPKDNPAQTPYPQDVAFPLVGWDPNNINRAISETEQQLAERNKRKGASLRVRLAGLKAIRAEMVESQRQASRTNPWAFIGGYDYSGWAGGDMGAGGVSPGMQDGGNPGGPNNIEVPDPVYGYGGDTQNPGQNKPFGADEANDRTNQPPNWQPGQPAQMDQGTVNPAGQTNDGGAPPFPNAPKTSALDEFLSNDPEIAKARRFLAQRKAAFEAGALPEYQG